MIHLPIRWRLTLWYSAVLAVILVLFSAGVFWQMGRHVLDQMDQELNAELRGVDEELEESSTPAAMSARLHRRFGHYEHLFFDIRYAGESEPLFTRRLGESPFPEPRPAAESDATLYQTYPSQDGTRWRIASRQVPAPGGTLLARVAGSQSAQEYELSELLASLLLAGPLALASAICGGYLLARRALAPIDRMTRLAREISAQRLNQRIEIVNQHDELGRLASTLNAMIARLEKSFADIQQFTADAAHELRTPITIMRNEAEVTLRLPRSSEEYRKSLESLLEECERLTHLADQLLFLCREDAGMRKPASADVQLDRVAAEVAEHVRALAQEKNVELRSTELTACRVRGDEDALRRLIFNLLDNAVKYTPQDGAVTLQVNRHDGHVEIIVSDTGAGIPADHVPHLFKRFYRVDAARQGRGTGLGLAISRAIVESHGGQIEIESQVGQGTRVKVTLNS